MSRAAFYPYPVAEDGISLDWEVEGDPPIEVVGDGVLDAQAIPDDDSLKLTLRAELASDVLDTVLSPEEAADPPVAVNVIVHSVSSRHRSAVELSPVDKDGIFEGQLVLPKRDFHEQVELEPVLLRTGDGNESDFAEHAAARLAWGDRVSVRVDEPPVPPGEYLEIEFEDFLASASKLRQQNPEALFALDTDRETPKLWLNSRVDELERVLRSTAPRGRIRRIKDAVYDTIVTQVWTSLVLQAVSTLAVQIQAESEEETGDDPMGALKEWEQRVIGYWAPKLIPSASKKDAIEEVISLARDPHSLGELHDLLSVAIQLQARSPEAFRGMVRWLNEENL